MLVFLRGERGNIWSENLKFHRCLLPEVKRYADWHMQFAVIREGKLSSLAGYTKEQQASVPTIPWTSQQPRTGVWLL